MLQHQQRYHVAETCRRDKTGGEIDDDESEFFILIFHTSAICNYLQQHSPYGQEYKDDSTTP